MQRRCKERYGPICVALDIKILVSALIAAKGNPADVYRHWETGRFTLMSCAEQLFELRSTEEKPRVAVLIHPHQAGRLVNQLKGLAEDVSPLPQVERSPDPNDDFLLALAEAGKADSLVARDKGGLLALHRHKSTRMISAKKFGLSFD